jgi:hypothetical protein
MAPLAPVVAMVRFFGGWLGKESPTRQRMRMIVPNSGA